MRILLKTKFGSHIYGTNLPSSDIDYKSIYLPTAYTIFTQNVVDHYTNNTKEDSKSKNGPDDIDDEQFSLKRYLDLLCEGQTVALDMLFTPEEFYITSTPEWEYIKTYCKENLLHKGVSSFIGYTKAQAAKYGVKGFRVRALKDTLDWLSKHEDFKRLHETDYESFVLSQSNELVQMVTCKGPNGIPAPHLQICNRKLPLHASVKYASEIFQKIYDEYGHRALLAEKNEGIDWKALMHAVRVACEAKELLLTGNITFPRPEKELLLKIRKGEMDYKDVEIIIEQGLVTLEETQKKSTLPSGPNLQAKDTLLYQIQKDYILDML